MKAENNKKFKNLLKGKAYYAVIASLVLLIVGVSAAIINVAKVKDSEYGTDDDIDEIYSALTTEYRANLNQTGIADERTTTAEPTTAGNVPYKGNYIMPVENNVIKGYSDGDMVFSKTMQDWRTHDGIDIKAQKGESVRAVDDGVVTDVSTDDLWGGIVTVTHKNGLVVKYKGVKATVKNGVNVKQGDIIAQVDTLPIESSDESHIHIECEVNQKNVDPIKALNLVSQVTE